MVAVAVAVESAVLVTAVLVDDVVVAEGIPVKDWIETTSTCPPFTRCISAFILLPNLSLSSVSHSSSKSRAYLTLSSPEEEEEEEGVEMNVTSWRYATTSCSNPRSVTKDCRVGMMDSGIGLNANKEGRSRSSLSVEEGKVDETALKRLVMMVVIAAGV